MSDTDSFIDEVTEEVRRERLWRLVRRYGWIAVLVVVGIVSTAAVFEWRKAQEQAAAQALGDQLFAALARENPLSRANALASVDATGQGAAITLLLEAGVLAGVDTDRAGEALEAVAADETLPALYRDLAVLKLVVLPDYPLLSDAKIARLAPLTEPGRPLRLLALEHTAVLQLDRGEVEAARATLQQVAEDAAAPATQRQRAQQLLVILGTPEDGS